MNLLQRIQSLPEEKRRMILWVIVVILGITLFVFYIKNVQQRLKNLKPEELKEQLRIQELQEEIGGLPKIEMPKLGIPNVSEEDLKRGFEEIMEQTEQNAQ